MECILKSYEIPNVIYQELVHFEISNYKSFNLEFHRIFMLKSFLSATCLLKHLNQNEVILLGNVIQLKA